MRPIRLALVAVAAMTAASSCGADSPDGDPTPEPTAAELDVTVEARLGTGHPSGSAYRPEAEGLIAEYTVTNNSDGPILVVERRPDVGAVDVGIPLPDTEESTWVYADDDGVVRVTKEMFPVAGDAELGEPYAVPAVMVDAGESVTGRAFALTPLRRIAPSADAFDVPGPPELPSDASAWVFCVQVAPDPGTDDRSVITNYTPDLQVLCSEAAQLPPGALAGQ